MSSYYLSDYKKLLLNDKCLPRSIALTVILSTSMAQSELIFEDTFDSQADWQPAVQNENCIMDTDTEGCENVPTGWTYFWSSEHAHPAEYPGKEPIGQISNQQFRGASGKALVIWDESYGTRSQWGSDLQLIKKFNEEYPELYASYYIKFPSSYRWQGVEDSTAGTNQQKLFRAYNTQAGPSDSIVRTSLFSWGTYFFDLKMIAGIDEPRSGHQFRCSPPVSPKNYKCNATESVDNNDEGDLDGNTWTSSVGDGQWHKMEWYLKTNSNPGVHDGVVRFWMDGVLQYERSNIPFRGKDDNITKGFNVVTIGGNTNNVPVAEDNTRYDLNFEQWHAIDDFVVYDSMPNAASPPAPPAAVAAKRN